jgi:polysaccharide deacetylase family protein (PEP-CTERM system associated)
MGLTVTFDLEDNRRSSGQELRFERMSHRFLDFLSEQQIKATVFIVGDLVRDHADLIRRVSEEGHEVALHGLRHVPLIEVGQARLADELREGRELLEHVTQREVLGFRAPIFSLTPAAAWAVDQIADAGFHYSSSVLPARNPLHGWPGAPQRPFRWSNGLLELPCPVGGVGRAMLPFLGGVYLRYLPSVLTRRLISRADRSAVLWSYLHPYDLDPDEPFFVLPHAGWLTSRVLHARRDATLARLQATIEAADGVAPTLGAVAHELGSLELPSLEAC